MVNSSHQALCMYETVPSPAIILMGLFEMATFPRTRDLRELVTEAVLCMYVCMYMEGLSVVHGVEAPGPTLGTTTSAK